MASTQLGLSAQQAILVEKRWDLATAGVAAGLSALGILIGGRWLEVFAVLGPVLGLTAIYAVRSVKARRVPRTVSVAARLELDYDRSPWTWTLVFALATWLAAEAAQLLIGFGVGAAVAAYGSPTPDEDFNLISLANADSFFLVSLVVAAGVALPAGWALGQRAGRHAYLWVAIGGILGRAIFIVSALWAAGQMEAEIEPLAALTIHGVAVVVIVAVGLVGAWRGARRAESFQIASLYRALPPETRTVAYELLRDEAASYLAASQRDALDPRPAEPGADGPSSPVGAAVEAAGAAPPIEHR